MKIWEKSLLVVCLSYSIPQVASAFVTSILTESSGFSISDVSAPNQSFFEAILDGAQEVDPVDTAASGRARLSLNESQTALEYEITLSGLVLGGTNELPKEVVGMHIHLGGAGTNGPVQFGMIGPTHDVDDIEINNDTLTIRGIWDESDVATGAAALSDSLDALKEGNLYINVHTRENRRGEIRGQIVAVPEPYTFALLSVALAAFLVSRRHKQ